MRNKLLFLGLAVLAVSCQSKVFYQVFTTTPQGGNIANNQVEFENEHIKTGYSLWREGGSMGFSVQNKTNDEVTVLVNQSFYVENDWTYDYFDNSSKKTNVKTYTTEDETKNFGNFFVTSTNKKNTQTVSTVEETVMEKETEMIPPGAKRYYSKFNVTNGLYVSCDMAKYPTKKSINKLTFTEETSPYVFYNYISYMYKGETFNMVNKFYVAEIKNVKESEEIESKANPACNAGPLDRITIMIDSSPERFYIRYLK